MFKKVGRVALAAAFASSMMIPAAAVTAFADDEPAATPDRDGEVSYTGLVADDSVALYQVIQQNPTTGAWELAEGVNTATVTRDGKEVTVVAGTADKYYKGGQEVESDTEGAVLGISVDEVIDGISADEAGILAAQKNTAAETIVATEESVTYELPTTMVNGESVKDLGTYMAIVTPSDNKTIYAPMFASADYTVGGNSVATSDSLAEPAVAVAKKSTVGIDKKATDSTSQKGEGDTKDADNDSSTSSVGVGDTVTFEVDSNIPTYTSNQTNATYTLEDSLSKGLTITEAGVKIKVGDDEATYTTGGNYKVGSNTAVTNGAYDFKLTLEDKSWKIEFDKSFLIGNAGAPNDITVTYSALVGEDAATANINEMENTAKVTYTHTPDGNTTSEEDNTKHYTYSIDAGIDGSEESNSEELVKIGVDSKGQPISETKIYKNNEKRSPLEGASFKLTGKANGNVYTANSDENGYLSFSGLDAGEYTLVETAAPAGFVLDTHEYTVVITPSFKDKDGNEIAAGATVPDNATLTGYTVTVDGTVVGDYTVQFATNHGSTTTVKTEVSPAFLKNVQNPSLPTTGGMGTMGLTIAGVVLIAGGALFMIRNRRRNEQQ